jgi:hypothetical protein
VKLGKYHEIRPDFLINRRFNCFDFLGTSNIRSPLKCFSMVQTDSCIQTEWFASACRVNSFCMRNGLAGSGPLPDLSTSHLISAGNKRKSMK